MATDANASRIAGLVFCSLVEADESGGYRPSLAESWSRLDDQTYEFRLRAGAFFHDGTPVTADDVVATYRSVLDGAVASPKRAAMSSIGTVESDGIDVVRMRLTQRSAAVLEAAGLGILPRALAGRSNLNARELVGCGPYRILAVDEDQGVQLEAFPGWYGGTPALASLRFRVVPDSIMRVLELRYGSLHLVQNALEPDAVAYLAEHEPSLRVLLGPYDAVQYLSFRHDHPALRDLRVRRAIAHAVDGKAIVTHVLRGQARVATGLLPPHHWAFHGNVRTYDHDPSLARALLDSAGIRDADGDGPQPRLRLRYRTSTVELRRRIGEVLAAQLAEVGIELEVQSHEWGTFFEDVRRGDFDLHSLAWIGIRDPDLFRLAFHSKMTPPAGSNRGRFADRVVDRLSERGQSTLDPARRRRIYARLQRRTARLLPYVMLWWPNNVVVASARLDGFTPHPTGDLTGLARARMRP
ncbi:MAG TPA: ABC transporter substrate-binding protein [Candidatus Limnocylindrales bacterium]|nr:ABC transporter substrate-binding protein [Candidatus Limnocylindrales bacterium]